MIGATELPPDPVEPLPAAGVGEGVGEVVFFSAGTGRLQSTTGSKYAFTSSEDHSTSLDEPAPAVFGFGDSAAYVGRSSR